MICATNYNGGCSVSFLFTHLLPLLVIILILHSILQQLLESIFNSFAKGMNFNFSDKRCRGSCEILTLGNYSNKDDFQNDGDKVRLKLAIKLLTTNVPII